MGETSGAQATVTNLRLISDVGCRFIWKFILIPNPNNVNHPRFETGTKTVYLTLTMNLIMIANDATTIGWSRHILLLEH